MRQVFGGQPDINKDETVSRWAEALERDEGRQRKDKQVMFGAHLQVLF